MLNSASFSLQCLNICHDKYFCYNGHLYRRVCSAVFQPFKYNITYAAYNIIIVIFYCCFDLWLNTYIYGSLESALTRFYVKRPVAEVPNILITFQLFFYKAIVAFAFIFRYYYNCNGKKSNLLYVVVLLLVLIAFPKGSRGAVISPIMILLTADLFAKRFLLNFILTKRIREYIILGSFVFALFFLKFRNSIIFSLGM